MKIGDEVMVHGFIDEIRKDVIIIRNEGGCFGTVESEIRGGTTITADHIKSGSLIMKDVLRLIGKE